MRKLEYILLSIILLGGFSVRLYKINNPVADWHSWRQADTASVSRIFLEKGIDLLHPRYHDLSSAQTGAANPEGWRMVEFPLYNSLHVWLTKGFPAINFEVWGRLISITAAVVSTLFIYLIANRYLGRPAGLLVAFFYAFLPFNIYFTRVIMPDPLSITLALGAIWFFEGNWFVAALLFAASLLVKPFTIFYLPVFWFLAKDRRSLLPFIIIAFAPLVAWRMWINQFPEGIAHIKWMFNSDRILGKPSFWRWIFGERIGHLILGSWGLIPFAFGLVSFARKKAFPLIFFLSSLLFVFIFATANVRHDYYQLFLVPSICFLLAQGTFFLWRQGRTHRLLVVISVFLALVTAGFQVREFYKINNPAIVEAGKAVDKLAPKDALVIAPYNKDTAFLYQTNRSGWPFVDGSLDDLISQGADYYVSVNLSDPVTQTVMEEYQVIETRENYIIVKL